MVRVCQQTRVRIVGIACIEIHPVSFPDIRLRTAVSRICEKLVVVGRIHVPGITELPEVIETFYALGFGLCFG